MRRATDRSVVGAMVKAVSSVFVVSSVFDGAVGYAEVYYEMTSLLYLYSFLC